MSHKILPPFSGFRVPPRRNHADPAVRSGCGRPRFRRTEDHRLHLSRAHLHGRQRGRRGDAADRSAVPGDRSGLVARRQPIAFSAAVFNVGDVYVVPRRRRRDPAAHLQRAARTCRSPSLRTAATSSTVRPASAPMDANFLDALTVFSAGRGPVRARGRRARARLHAGPGAAGVGVARREPRRLCLLPVARGAAAQAADFRRHLRHLDL